MENSKEHIEAQLAAYIDGELDDAERAEIERHLAQSPRHRTLIQELLVCRNLVRDLPRASSPAELNDLLTVQLERSALLNPDQGSDDVLVRINRWPQFAAVAAVLVLAVGLAVVVMCVLPPVGGTQNPVAINTPPDGATYGTEAPATRPTSDFAPEDLKPGDMKKTKLKELEKQLKAANGTVAPKQSRPDGESLAKNADWAAKALEEKIKGDRTPENMARPDVGDNRPAMASQAEAAKGVASKDFEAGDARKREVARLQADPGVITGSELERLRSEFGWGENKTADYVLVIQTDDVAQAQRQVTTYLAQNHITYMAGADEVDRGALGGVVRNGEGAAKPGEARDKGGDPGPIKSDAASDGPRPATVEPARRMDDRSDQVRARAQLSRTAGKMASDEADKNRSLEQRKEIDKNEPVPANEPAGNKGPADMVKRPTAPTAPPVAVPAPAKPMIAGGMGGGRGGSGPGAAPGALHDAPSPTPTPEGPVAMSPGARSGAAPGREAAERENTPTDPKAGGNYLVATMNWRQAVELRERLSTEQGQQVRLELRASRRGGFQNTEARAGEDAPAAPAETKAAAKPREDDQKAQDGLRFAARPGGANMSGGAGGRERASVDAALATQPATAPEAAKPAAKPADDAIEVVIVIRTTSTNAAAAERGAVPADANRAKDDASKK